MSRKVFGEGICRGCGSRITVDRGDPWHQREGKQCGPVETEHPFGLRDHAVDGRTQVAPVERCPTSQPLPAADAQERR